MLNRSKHNTCSISNVFTSFHVWKTSMVCTLVLSMSQVLLKLIMQTNSSEPGRRPLDSSGYRHILTPADGFNKINNKICLPREVSGIANPILVILISTLLFARGPQIVFPWTKQLWLGWKYCSVMLKQHLLPHQSTRHRSRREDCRTESPLNVAYQVSTC